MLVLSRRPGEKLIIGDSVTVEVVSVRGDNVKLGITAPRELSIDRQEIRELKLKGAERDATSDE